MLEKTLESPLDNKEIKLANPKGNQPWIFFGRTDAEAEASILWPPDVKNWLIGKDPDARKAWRQKRRRGWQRMRWFDGITDSMDMTLSKLQGTGDWCAAVHGIAKILIQLSDWTATTSTYQRAWQNGRLSKYLLNDFSLNPQKSLTS